MHDHLMLFLSPFSETFYLPQFKSKALTLARAFLFHLLFSNFKVPRINLRVWSVICNQNLPGEMFMEQIFLQNSSTDVKWTQQRTAVSLSKIKTLFSEKFCWPKCFFLMIANTHMASKNMVFCPTLQVNASAGVGETYTNNKSVTFI